MVLYRMFDDLMGKVILSLAAFRSYTGKGEWSVRNVTSEANNYINNHFDSDDSNRDVLARINNKLLNSTKEPINFDNIISELISQVRSRSNGDSHELDLAETFIQLCSENMHGANTISGKGFDYVRKGILTPSELKKFKENRLKNEFSCPGCGKDMEPSEGVSIHKGQCLCYNCHSFNSIRCHCGLKDCEGIVRIPEELTEKLYALTCRASKRYKDDNDGAEILSNGEDRLSLDEEDGPEPFYEDEDRDEDNEPMPRDERDNAITRLGETRLESIPSIPTLSSTRGWMDVETLE